MNAASTPKHRHVPANLIAALLCLVIISAVSLAWRFHERRPRVWSTSEVPVVFWSWRNTTPAQKDVENAIRGAHAQALFLRAGQIDAEAGKLSRVRAVKGKFPNSIEIHLVYNATRALLMAFENVDVNALAVLLSETYARDIARANVDVARVAGIQLDMDVPTRLLERYEQLLKALRARLPLGTKLSITGLATWMDSSNLASMLNAVDFWIPQCYGAVIPEKSSQLVPISSPEAVAETISRVRKLDHPFYAGLPAYGYAILYSPRGNLIEVRGDLDPLRVASDPNFELVERRPFRGISRLETPTESEWRYMYRARGDGVTDGLVVHEGDTLMLDVPTAESLRGYSRSVREEAGDKLLGICVFRLPGDDDTTALTIDQVKAALADSSALIQTNVQLNSVYPANNESSPGTSRMRVHAMNKGIAGGQLGDDALTVSLRVPAGSVRGVAEIDGFFSLETLCDVEDAMGTNNPGAIRPCSLRRANLLLLRARTWKPGASAQANISFDGQPPQSVSTIVTVLADDGRSWQQVQTITVGREDE